MATTSCPNCGAPLEGNPAVCHECFFIIDHERWHEHDAGRLGADATDRAHDLEDPPVGPLPVAPGLGGFAANAFRLFGVGKALRWGRSR